MVRKNQRLELTWYNKDKALIPVEEGRYKYAWVDQSDPRYCETRPLVYGEKITGTQAPKEDGVTYSERADIPPTDDNLLIIGESGDALEALTRIPELVDKYKGKVKLVYIDPPFNTGGMFKDYDDALEHSVWLTMMRDRLYHLKDLLVPGGTIWVHLDDRELHRMRILLDEVFDANNFIAEMVWQGTYSPKNNGHGVSTGTDFILVYAKAGVTPLIKRLPRTEKMNASYKNPDDDPRGRWTNGDPAANHSVDKRQHPGVYGIQHPFTGEMMYPPASANWRFAQDTVLEMMREWGNYVYGEVTDEERRRRSLIEGPGIEIRDDVKPLVIPDWGPSDVAFAQARYDRGAWPVYWFTGGGTGGMRRKTYLNEVAGRIPENWLPYEEVGHTDSAKKELSKIIPNIKPFDTPKPERLLERIIHISTDPGDIVLDVFAGSGTTAAVAQKMGRRWVTAELQADTVTAFTLPRLTRVVDNEDPGGITLTAGERVDAAATGLPKGMTVEDAQTFTTLLNKALKAEEKRAEAEDRAAADEDTAKAMNKLPVIKKLKAWTKTAKTKDTVNWRGGGGFRVATLAPACYDYDADLEAVTLTPAATGDTLIQSVCAQEVMAFRYTPDDVFHGKKGSARLYVHEGLATKELVDSLLAYLPQDNSLVLAATEVDDGVRSYLRKARKGSKVMHVPDELFAVTAEMRENPTIIAPPVAVGDNIATNTNTETDTEEDN